MSERFIYDKNHNPTRKSPIIEAETRTTLGVLDLDYENTRLRLFGEGYKHMSHVEYRNRKGLVTGIFLDQFVKPDLSEQLVKLDYDHSFDNVPPQEDVDWYDRAFLIKNNISLDDPTVVEVAETGVRLPVQESQLGIRDLAMAGAEVISALKSTILNKLK